MEYFILIVVPFFASGLTLFSGFGLGTLLLPVFSLFFPVEVAVGATALVHGANNVFKVVVTGRHADRDLVLRFGIPAVLAAFLGAGALGIVSGFSEIVSYDMGGHRAVITPLKVLMGLLMAFFSLFELVPSLRRMRFKRRYLLAGGLLSGFFGGFSGHQGALRSAFLTKTGIATETFVGTNALIGFLVDLSRIIVYYYMFLIGKNGGVRDGVLPWALILTAVAAAFAGVLFGKRFLRKITMGSVQTLTGILLLAIALGLGSGVL